jgi:hypothetical protein
MRVLRFKRSHHLFAGLRFPVVIFVFKLIYVRDAVDHCAIYRWQHADRNIQSVVEICKLVGFTITIGVFQYRNPVATLTLSRKGVFERLCYPHAPLCIKRQVDGFADVGFGCEQVYFKTFRQFEAFLFICWCTCFRRADMFVKFRAGV